MRVVSSEAIPRDLVIGQVNVFVLHRLPKLISIRSKINDSFFFLTFRSTKQFRRATHPLYREHLIILKSHLKTFHIK